jgi:hypothetical protein
MSITATVENGTIRLPPVLDVPDGTTVELTLPERPAPAAQPGATLAWMLAFAGTVEGPADLAAEHEHYLQGRATHNYQRAGRTHHSGNARLLPRLRFPRQTSMFLKIMLADSFVLRSALL